MKDNGEYMKKIYKILILIFIFMIQINVHAEDTISLTTLPKQYLFDGYEFTIEGFDLRVYEIDNENDDEGWDHYTNNEPDKIIPITDGIITISPTTDSTTLYDVSTTLVDLNLTLTKEQIEELLINESINPTSETSYLTEITVKYKLTKSKIESAYMYNFSLFKAFTNLLLGREWRNKVLLNETIAQPINIAIYSYDEETNNNDLFYETKLTEENNFDTLILNYLILSTDELSDSNDRGDALLMFHSLDNIDYLIDNLTEIEDDTNDSGDDIKDEILNHPTTSTTKDTTNQIVKVDNTLSKIPKYFIAISIFMIILGTTLISYTLGKE